jgi:hypothetical protein
MALKSILFQPSCPNVGVCLSVCLGKNEIIHEHFRVFSFLRRDWVNMAHLRDIKDNPKPAPGRASYVVREGSRRVPL